MPICTNTLNYMQMNKIMVSSFFSLVIAFKKWLWKLKTSVSGPPTLRCVGLDCQRCCLRAGHSVCLLIVLHSVPAYFGSSVFHSSISTVLTGLYWLLSNCSSSDVSAKQLGTCLPKETGSRVCRHLSTLSEITFPAIG